MDYMTLEKYLKSDECQAGHFYRGAGRNFSIGLCVTGKDGEKRFKGIRSKWGTEYVDSEIHFDDDNKHGTFKPIEDLNELFPIGSLPSDHNECLFIKLKMLEGGKVTPLEMVQLERFRQITAEGYNKEHDLEHNPDEFALAAAAYAINPNNISEDTVNFLKDNGFRGIPWPWEPASDKRAKHDRKRSLVIAGALILAALEREMDDEDKTAQV
jgi:hypothetical protein